MGNRIKIDLEFEDSTKTIGKYLVFDLETTGFPIDRYASPDDFKNWPYVVQIAWILFDDEHKIIEHQNFYIKQPVEIPADATNIHGITTAMMLEKGIEPSNVYANFKKAIDNTEYLISHNIDFDIPIVHCDFLRNDIQWDFPSSKMICTMKAGSSFCKIPPQRNGEYKWPKLTELYQKCFYPGYTMSIFPDATSTKNMHSAVIDAAMTAQCFFKLKELGLFKDFKTETTSNSLFIGILSWLFGKQNKKPNPIEPSPEVIPVKSNQVDTHEPGCLTFYVNSLQKEFKEFSHVGESLNLWVPKDDDGVKILDKVYIYHRNGPGGCLGIVPPEHRDIIFFHLLKELHYECKIEELSESMCKIKCRLSSKEETEKRKAKGSKKRTN